MTQRAGKKQIQVNYGETVSIIPISDIHLGHAYCDETALIERLKYARAKNARLVLLGDLFDLVLPKDNKRYDPSQCAKWVRDSAEPMDAQIDRGIEIFKPYADLIDFTLTGNHEQTIQKYYGSNPIKRFLQGLYDDNWQNQCHYGYGGFFRYTLDCNGMSSKFDIYATHGASGSAPVTKGIIEFNRLQSVVIADIYLLGHNHQTMSTPQMVYSVNTDGSIKETVPRSVRCGTFLSMPLQTGCDEGMAYTATKGLYPSVVSMTELLLSIGRDKNGRMTRNFSYIEQGKM